MTSLHQTLQAAAAQTQQAHRHLHIVDARTQAPLRVGCCVVCRRALWKHFGERNQFVGCEKAARHGR